MKKKEYYFDEKEQQAVIDYILSDSRDEKDKIYNNILKKPFQKMIQSILRKYPVHIGNYEMKEVEHRALTHLIENMVKYRPYIIESKRIDSDSNKWVRLGDGYKFIFYKNAKKKLDELNNREDKEHIYKISNYRAYSYCQTIIRNYFKDHGKKTYNDKKINLSYDDYIDEVHEDSEYHYELDDVDHHMLDKLIDDIIVRIREKIENTDGMKQNEIIVGEAVINILNNWQSLFMEDTPSGKYNKKVTNNFAKNKILFFLKEQTGLTTKEMRMALKPFKEMYFLEKIKYMDD